MARRRGGAAWPGHGGAGTEERFGPPGELRARRPRGRYAAGERTLLAIARTQVTRHVPSPSPGRARAPRPRLPRPGAGSRRRRRRQGASGRPAGAPGERARLPDGLGRRPQRRAGGAAGPRVPRAPGPVLRPRTPLALCGRIKLNSDPYSCCGRRFSLLFLSSFTVRPSRARWVGWSVSL